MINAVLIQIIGRLVKQENIRILDKRVGEEKPGLLAAGKFADIFVQRQIKMHDIKNIFDEFVQIVFFLVKSGGKIFPHRKSERFFGHHLASHSNGGIGGWRSEEHKSELQSQ